MSCVFLLLVKQLFGQLFPLHFVGNLQQKLCFYFVCVPAFLPICQSFSHHKISKKSSTQVGLRKRFCQKHYFFKKALSYLWIHCSGVILLANSPINWYGISSGFLNLIQDFPISNFFLEYFGYSVTNQFNRFSSA